MFQPLHPLPPAPAQAGQQAQQQQEHPAPPAQQKQQIVHLNWSNFKPEFSGKPDEDAETCLLCINDWMNVHHFIEGVKVQIFCLTLLGEAMIMVTVIRTNKCRLARVTQFI